MKKIFFFVFVIALTACNDAAKEVKNEQTQKKDSIIVNDSSSKIELTAEEQQDDSTTGATSWENAGINDPLALKIFVKKLKMWASLDNKDSIAANIQFPLTNNAEISSPEIFKQKYDTLFNGNVKHALANQDLRKIFRNAQGAMIGNGEIWISNIAENGPDVFRIISLNYK